MDLLCDVAWDGKGDFSAWKKEILAALADKLRARFAGFGESVHLGPVNLQVRRGRTWGFDLWLSPRKGGAGAPQLKLEYACRLIDDSLGPGVALTALVMIAAACYWVRSLVRTSSHLIAADLALVVLGPVLLGFAVLALWIGCVSQLAKRFGSPPVPAEFERLMEEVRGFVRQRDLGLPADYAPAAATVVRKHIRPKLGEEIVFASALTEQEWLKRIQDEYPKTFHILPMRLEVAAETVFLFVPGIRPDPLKSAFYGRLEKNAAGGVMLRGRFKIRPPMALLLGGLASFGVFILGTLCWEKPGTLYQPVLAVAALYAFYRFAVWIDGDNREEISCLLETAS